MIQVKCKWWRSRNAQSF